MIAITFWSFLGLRLRQASEGKPLQRKRAANSFARRSRRPKKLQNVMAITDVLELFWQSQHNQKRGTSMIPVILALGLAVGMAMTTAFAFGLLPLVLM